MQIYDVGPLGKGLRSLADRELCYTMFNPEFPCMIWFQPSPTFIFLCNISQAHGFLTEIIRDSAYSALTDSIMRCCSELFYIHVLILPVAQSGAARHLHLQIGKGRFKEETEPAWAHT